MTLRVLSLGAGVQSTTLALLAAHGEIEAPDCAIFADTQSEPAAVYEHLNWLMSANVLPFPVHLVTVGNLGDELLRSTRGESPRGSNARPPFYVLNPDGSHGMIRRQCTGDYKIDPIQKKMRDLLGLKPRQHWPRVPVAEQWIGISTDEAHRMKPSRIAAIENRWPLVEIRMSRNDCVKWLGRQGYPRPPKQWRELRDNDPEAFSSAILLDEAVRGGFRGHSLDGKLFAHASRTPLAQVDFSTSGERGQPDLFGNECEGMCGL